MDGLTTEARMTIVILLTGLLNLLIFYWIIRGAVYAGTLRALRRHSDEMEATRPRMSRGGGDWPTMQP